MYSYSAITADEVWRTAVLALNEKAEPQVSRTYKEEETTETMELLRTNMTIYDPMQRIIFSRPINPAFAIAEVIWILAGGNELRFVEFWNPRMKEWSDDGVTLHGAYGWRLGSRATGGHFNVIAPGYYEKGHDQLYQVYETLRNAPHSRQAILQVWDKRYDLPFIGLTGTPNSKDIPCNIIADLKVRDGKLHWFQYMRSNDLIWGTPYNFIQWMTLQEIVAGWLGLEMGTYEHGVGSLHVYAHHYTEMEDLVKDLRVGGHETPFNQTSLAIEGYDQWAYKFKTVATTANVFTQVETKAEILNNLEFAVNTLNHQGYEQWLWLLAAEALRRRKLMSSNDIAMDTDYNFIQNMGPCYAQSWIRWFEYVDRRK